MIPPEEKSACRQCNNRYPQCDYRRHKCRLKQGNENMKMSKFSQKADKKQADKYFADHELVPQPPKFGL
jgi:hypothetical protein